MQGELHYLLLKCFRSSHKFIVQETSKISLLPGQPKVLECLRERDGLSPKEIGTLCGIDKSTMTSLLAKMERQKLVSRTDNREDRRAIHIWLTPQGRVYADQVAGICRRADELAQRNLTESQQKELLRLLQIVSDTFEEKISEEEKRK